MSSTSDIKDLVASLTKHKAFKRLASFALRVRAEGVRAPRDSSSVSRPSHPTHPTVPRETRHPARVWMARLGTHLV